MEKSELIEVLLNVFKQLGRDIKKILLLFSISSKQTAESTVGKNHFSNGILYNDCERNLKIIFPELKSWDFRDLWKEVTTILNSEGIDYLLNMRKLEQEIIYEYYEKEVSNFILNKVKNLKDNYKFFLIKFLETCPEYAYELDIDPWQSEFWDMMSSYPKMVMSQEEYKEFLISLALLFSSTWITNKGKNNGINYLYPKYFDSIKDPHKKSF